MKKSLIILFSLGILFPFSKMQSQDTLKSFNNNWSTELNFNPFNGNLSFNNAAGQIKFRYFEPGGKAWRLAITYNFNKDNEKIKSVYGTNPYDNSYLQRTSFVGLTAGREKHFNSSRRLSPYIGWETGFGIKSSYAKINTPEKDTEIKGATIKYEQIPSSQYPSQYIIMQTFGERGFWSVSGNLVIGFDFYMSRKFYFGYEMLFGLDYISYSDIKITEELKNTSNNNNPSTYPNIDEESWKFGPKLLNGLRIGFVF